MIKYQLLSKEERLETIRPRLADIEQEEPTEEYKTSVVFLNE